MADDSWPSPNHNSRAVGDVEYDTMLSAYAPDGIVGSPADLPLVFADSSGRLVKVRSGRTGSLRGRAWSSGASNVSLTITANTSGSTRFDLVVLRYNRTTFDVRAVVITGTPGSGVPSPVNNASFNDIALASVHVGNGVSVIAATDVTSLNWFLAPGSTVCTSTTRPPHAVGLEIYETDTGKVQLSDGSNWVLLHQDTGWINCTPISGWSIPAAGFDGKIRVINGVAHLVLEVQRTGGAVGANANSGCAVYGAQYAPAFDLPAFTQSGGIARIRTDGTVQLASHPTINTGDLVTFQTVSWPVG